ncbi:pyridoxamine 5'-phosphate oxidase family protein [Methanoculleus sp.]|uniref:pyridoxamine 5'-phosphate oxidase family protein n=1 Tax=Methanoculleus sp. TaxID=90427 RepID=UPI00262EF83C|nr:pyridoxamine 5'-phosphate oxidase family protein [Methanoculleus sp.]MDI6866536.1 pyridoxamine 5'-phosphate oxidase family protein [Methanoculleus sp.]
MSSRLMDYFNKQPRVGILSTANREGKVNAAVFGSPRMVDEKTIVMGLGKNRTLEYLQENPYAVYTILEQGKTLMDWKGIRVYMKLKDYATSGEKLEAYKREVAAALGEDAAKMMHATLTFEVTEVRPIVDMGQGWEKSI